MTYEEFAKAVKTYCRVIEEGKWDTSYKYVGKHNYNDYLLYDERHSGGIRGGSCWDDESENNNYSYTSDDPWDNSLKTILREHAPTITFLQFDELENLYKEDSYSVNEYYGNCTDYQIRTISLKILYDKLHGWGYL